MRRHNIIVWVGTLAASSLVLAVVLLVVGLRGARGVAAAPAPVAPSAPVVAATITPTLTFTVAEPVLLNRPVLVTTTVAVTPTQSYRVNFDVGASQQLVPIFTGTQTLTTTLVFTATGTQVVTAELLRRPEELYKPLFFTQTVAVIDPDTPTTLRLIAKPEEVAADDLSSATITASIQNALGEPVPEREVRFSTTRGTLSPATPVATDADGVATVQLRSRDSGNATVTAQVADLTRQVTVTFATQIPADIKLSEPLTTTPIIADGQQPVNLSIQLLDQFNMPVPSELVSFSTNLGTWGVADPYADEVIALNQATQVTTTRTTAEGFARARLIAPAIVTGTNQTATIIVAAGSASEIISVTFTRVPDSRLSLTAGTAQAQVCTAGVAAQPVPITASLTIDNATPVAGQQVQLSTTAGSFSEAITQTNAVATTDPSGNISTTLFVRAQDFSRSPNIVVTTQFGTQTTPITISQQCLIYLPIVTTPPIRITFTTPQNSEQLVAVAEPITFTAEFSANTTPITNTMVEFTTTTGILSPLSGQTDTAGKIIGTLTLTSTDTATVTARLKERNTTGAPLIVTATQPQLSFINPPATVEAESATPLTLTLELAANGKTRPLANRAIGLTVTGGGSILPSTTTDANGQAFVTYTAPTTAGEATITARSDGAVDKQQRIAIREIPLTVELSGLPELIGIGQQQLQLRTRVTRRGTPLSGERVTLTLADQATGIGFAPSSAGDTDSNGFFNTNVTALSVGKYTIQAKIGLDNTPLAQQEVNVVPLCSATVPNNTNNTVDDASPFTTFGGACFGDLGDGTDSSDPGRRQDDYYRIRLSANQQITVSLPVTSPDATYEVSLVRFDNASTVARGPQAFNYTIPASGPFDYVLRVRSITSGTANIYILDARNSP